MRHLIVPFYERARHDRQRKLQRIHDMTVANKEFSKEQMKLYELSNRDIRELMETHRVPH